MTAESGYVRIYRKLYDHPVFRTQWEACLFAWMVAKAQWRPTRVRTRYGMVDLDTGQLLVAERDFEEQFRLHRNVIRRLLQSWVEERMISLKRDHDIGHIGTIVTVVNYRSYQGIMDIIDLVEDHDGTTVGTMTGPRKDHVRTMTSKTPSLELEKTGANKVKNLRKEESSLREDTPLPPKGGADVGAPPPLCPASSIPIPNVTDTPKRAGRKVGATRSLIPAGMGPEMVAEFETFFTLFGRPERKKEAREQYLRARREVDAQTLLDGARMHAMARPPSMRRQACEWLRGAQWNDQPVARTAPPRDDGLARLQAILAQRSAAQSPDGSGPIIDGQYEEQPFEVVQ